MFKIAGITGLVISCGLIGVVQNRNLKRRIDLLEDFYQMILILKSNINYFKEPLIDIFTKLSKNGHSKAYLLLNEIVIDISNKNLEIPQIWANNVSLAYNKSSLTKKDIEVMSYLGSFIGQTDYINQLQHFQYLEENLKIQIEQAKEELKCKGPMYNKIGYFIGAIIGILLI